MLPAGSESFTYFILTEFQLWLLLPRDISVREEAQRTVCIPSRHLSCAPQSTADMKLGVLLYMLYCIKHVHTHTRQTKCPSCPDSHRLKMEVAAGTGEEAGPVLKLWPHNLILNL